MKPRDGHTEAYWEAHDKETYNCPRCGRAKEKVRRFEVHHKDTNPRNGDMGNLVGLCLSCHREEHSIVPGKREGSWQERFFNEYKSDKNPLKYL